MCAMIAYFYAASVAEIRESGAIVFVTFDYYSYLCTMQPFCGLSRKKISGVVSLAPDIFFLFELFPENIWRFQRNTLYLQHPIKLY